MRSAYEILVLAGTVAWLAAAAGLAQERGLQTEPDDPFAPVGALPDDLELIEGDIAVPRGWRELRTTFTLDRWTNGVVPYDFGPNVTATNQNLMLAAMDEWESLANVSFVPRNNQANYIFIRNATFNAAEWSGMVGGEQRLFILSWTNHGTLVHELGHVLGYWHEQNRGDRNQYVDINWNNICQNCCSDAAGNAIPCDDQFTIRSSGGEHGPYDFASIMHYGSCAWTACGSCSPSNTNCRTIDVLPPNDVVWQSQIGTANNASYWDGRIMSFLYPEDDWVFAADASVIFPIGDFLLPFETFSAGYNGTPTDGKLWLYPGEYSFTGTLDKPMQIESTSGIATIGS